MNITDKTKPHVTSFLETSCIAQDMCMNKHYIYLVDGTAGLKIIDIKNPKKPKIVKTLNIKYANSVCCKNGYIYAADKNSGLAVVKSDNIVKNIKNPKTDKLYLQGDRLYLIKNDGGVDIFNIQNGYNLRFVSTINSKCSRDVYIDDDDLYMFCKNKGVSIYLPLFDKE